MSESFTRFPAPEPTSAPSHSDSEGHNWRIGARKSKADIIFKKGNYLILFFDSRTAAVSRSQTKGQWSELRWKLDKPTINQTVPADMKQ